MVQKVCFCGKEGGVKTTSIRSFHSNLLSRRSISVFEVQERKDGPPGASTSQGGRGHRTMATRLGIDDAVLKKTIGQVVSEADLTQGGGVSCIGGVIIEDSREGEGQGRSSDPPFATAGSRSFAKKAQRITGARGLTVQQKKDGGSRGHPSGLLWTRFLGRETGKITAAKK